MLYSLSLINDLFTVGVSSLAILPYVITAFMLGLILAQVYMVLCRMFEAKVLRALHSAGAIGKGQSLPLGTVVPEEKALKLVLFLLASPSASLYRWVSHDIIDSRAENGFTAKKKGGKSESIRMKITKDTKLYIKEDALAYVEERGMQYTPDHWMTVVYTVIACAIAWFILLYTLDDLLALFM